MAKSRGKKAFINTIVGFASEIVSFACGLILPRLILSHFGSTYNGIVSSITQFISVISLMQAGIGGVTRAALYKPLADKDTRTISEIVKQTESFMRKIAIAFVGSVLVFAAIYPFMIHEDFDWFFTFSLIIIISLSTFAQYYFGLTYKMLFNSDQKQYIPLLFSIISTLANTAIASFIIVFGGTIHAVKLGSSIVFVLSPLVMSIYGKKKYSIDSDVHPKTDLIKQRWDAMGHEVASFINNNTDIMVLTIFSSLVNVSVYTVYHAVIVGIRKVVINFVMSFGAAFGNMHALKQYELMEKNLRVYEVILYSLSTIVYSTTIVMITPFVMIYTRGINDAQYFQPAFGIIISLAGAFSCFRYPYQTVVQAVGHFKQTRNGAFVEAALNIIISIVLVIKFGLIGVAIGTLVAAVFRTFQYGIYLEKHIIKRKLLTFVGHIIISLVVIVITYAISKLYIDNTISIMSWIIKAFITGLISFSLMMIFEFIFYRNDMRMSIKKILGLRK